MLAQQFAFLVITQALLHCPDVDSAQSHCVTYQKSHSWSAEERTSLTPKPGCPHPPPTLQNEFKSDINQEPTHIK